MYEWVHTMCTCPGLCLLNLNGSSRFGFIALYLPTFTWYTVGMTVSWSLNLPWEVHSFRRGTSGCSLRFPGLPQLQFFCCKRSKNGAGEGLGTRLSWCLCQVESFLFCSLAPRMRSVHTVIWLVGLIPVARAYIAARTSALGVYKPQH